MHQEETIYVTPVEHSRAKESASPDASKYFTYTDQGAPARPVSTAQTTAARTIPNGTEAKQPNRLTGLAQIVGGGACALVGVPMLILPGPGLLAIGGGVFLMAKGAKNLFGKPTTQAR